MAKTRADVTIINPTRNQQDPLFPLVLNKHDMVHHYKPIDMLPEFRIDKTFAFTHPYFKFFKPARISKKTSLKKPRTTYIGIYEPDYLGQGVYGSVHQVVAVWKLGTVPILKTTFKNRLAVKTNVFIGTSSTKTPNVDTHILYSREQSIGRYVPHMGLKYQTVTYNNCSFLLMNEQPGLNLGAVIDKLKVNPDFLSTTDKLKLTIELIEQFEKQVSQIKVCDIGTLVHRDIKPVNIMVDIESMTVRFIDYGHAKNVNAESHRAGTPLYTDPRLLEDPLLREDGTTDFSSLAKVIAELWGNTSFDAVKETAQLKEMNRINPLTGLLDSVKDLTLEEIEHIRNTIRSMTRYELNERKSPQQVLEIFKTILAHRKKEEDQKYQNLAQQIPLQGLDLTHSNEVFNILASTSSDQFIRRLQLTPEHTASIVRILGVRLLKLNPTVINSLVKDCGLDFSKFDLLNNNLKSQSLSAQQVKTLIKLGSVLDQTVFEYWVVSVDADHDPLKWAEICRVLYENTPSAADYINSMPDDGSLKSIYCRQLLKDSNIFGDDKTNIRLITRHIEIVKRGKALTQSMNECLTKCFKGKHGHLEYIVSTLCLVDNYRDMEEQYSKLQTLTKYKEFLVEDEKCMSRKFSISPAFQNLFYELALATSSSYVNIIEHYTCLFGLVLSSPFINNDFLNRYNQLVKSSNTNVLAEFRETMFVFLTTAFVTDSGKRRNSSQQLLKILGLESVPSEHNNFKIFVPVKEASGEVNKTLKTERNITNGM